MLKGNRLLCLTLLPIFMTPSTITPFYKSAMQITEKQVDNNEMVLKTDKLGLLINPIQEQYEKRKAENEKKKDEKAKKQKEKELEEQKKSEIENNKEYYTFVLTYYALLQEECGKTDGITASGKKISRGMIASPKVFKFGTKINIEGNEYIVEDRGSSKYINVNNDGSIRLDIYCPRNKGESNRDYSKRIESYGVDKKIGFIVK